MPLKLISFDVQGTLCERKFSEEVWQKLLPQTFEEERTRLGEEAYSTLLQQYEDTREDDLRFYDLNYWLTAAKSVKRSGDLIGIARQSPLVYPGLIELVEQIGSHLPCIVVSATTREFIQVELGPASRVFDAIYSTHDDFKIPGKPPFLFTELAKRRGVNAEECLHVGDHLTMDGINPKAAGWHSLIVNARSTDAERVALLSQVLKEHGSSVVVSFNPVPP